MARVLKTSKPWDTRNAHLCVVTEISVGSTPIEP